MRKTPALPGELLTSNSRAKLGNIVIVGVGCFNGLAR
jgi:hypothetical protein